jgi:glutamate carboxypeptidase
VHVTASSTGGGGDGAFASALGVPTVDGLGPVGGGYHTADEYVMVASLVERAVMAACLLVACAGGMPTPAR